MPLDFNFPSSQSQGSSKSQGNSNVASKILSSLLQSGGQQGLNAAHVNFLKMQKEEALKSNEYAVSLLAGVNSEEDLQIAKRMYIARYPEYADKIDKIIPSYDPRTINILRESLKDAAVKMREEELELGKDRLAFDIEKERSEMKGFAPGTTIFQGGKMVGRVPATEPKPEYDVFEGPAGQVYVEKGSKIPAGYEKVMGKGVTIQTGAAPVTKPTQTKLEQDIIEGVKNVQSFNVTKEKFKDEYLTWRGKAEKEVITAMDKAGISGKNQKKFIKERSDWFRRAKADFIAYRKWATGVAGGEQELKEIATSFPDPVKNSPAEYRSNLDSVEQTTKEVLSLNKEFIESGIDLNKPLAEIMDEIKKKGVDISAPPGTGTKGTPKPKASTILRFDKDGNLIEE